MIKKYTVPDFCMRQSIMILLVLFLVTFPTSSLSEESHKYGFGVDIFSLGYNTYQNGSPPDGEFWSGPSVFFTYQLEKILSIKASYYALSKEGYDMVDILPWRVFNKTKQPDMNGVQITLQRGTRFYGMVGGYKNFSDFKYVVDKQGVLLGAGYKLKFKGYIIDISPLNFRIPIQEGGSKHTSGFSSLGISKAF